MSLKRQQMMTQIIPSNLPVYFQCLGIPTEWSHAVRGIGSLGTANSLALLAKAMKIDPVLDGDFLRVKMKSRIATAFDPWEKRSEFLSLNPADTKALLKFLPTVGLFEPVEDVEEEEEREEGSLLISPAKNVYDINIL